MAGEAAMGIAGPLIAGGMGMLNAHLQNKMNVRLAKNQQRWQIEGAKELGEFNQGLALEMWDKTNFAAQRKQMEKAGLNIGLMYEGGGPGGTTQGGQTAPVAPTNVQLQSPVGMGMMQALQMAMMKAQIDNTNADTKTKEASIPKTGAETTNIGAETGLILQKTENEKINNSLLKWQDEILQIETRIKNNTDLDVIEAVKLANEKTKEEIREQRANANIRTETQNEIIKQLNTASQEQALRIQAQQLGLIKTGAEIEQVKQTTRKVINEVNIMVQNNMREWDKMSQKDKEIAISQKLAEIQAQITDFNTSTPEQLKQWTNLIMSVIPLANMGSGSNPIGFQR